VVEEGTARKNGFMPEVKAAGKTGTTDSYKDAWFVGFTGNYVAAVWFGNDDSSPTETVTGGFLPTMAWKSIMEYAHKDIELKPIPGLAPSQTPPGPVAARGKTQGFVPVSLSVTQRGRTLSGKAAATIVEIETLFKRGAQARAFEPLKPAALSPRRPVQKADSLSFVPLGRL
ncbi:MAG: hypothetical protein K2P80_04105, partial [Beijerinckiaceae bacterium]|nr:hypothetical protein [Beijerinckiaceae bacterium]